MDKRKKIVEVISFTNDTKGNYVTKYAMVKMNEFLSTIDAEDYISYEVDRNSSQVTVRLTYKKIVEN